MVRDTVCRELVSLAIPCKFPIIGAFTGENAIFAPFPLAKGPPRTLQFSHLWIKFPKQITGNLNQRFRECDSLEQGTCCRVTVNINIGLGEEAA